MIDNTLTQAAVTLLRNAEIDGETMESIINELGMREQMVHQMQLMDVQRMIATLANPTAVADAKTNTSISESDIETLADNIASRIASNADEYIDHSNIELSIDYDRQVNVDSIGLEETQIACTINDYLTNWLRSRNITITEE
jgi:glycerol-3-phosphate O-acyltransferase